MWTRRNVLAASLASGAIGLMPGRLKAGMRGELRAAPGEIQLAPEGYGPTQVWGYSGGVPGPVLRLRQGERVGQRLINALPQPTTIHWHGIRIENGMDGVPGLTQAAVAPGESFDYGFAVPDAGTYWYHPHNRTWEQLARGLYGALIVEEATPPQVDRDEVLLIDDWRLDDDARLHDSFGNLHDWAHAGRMGNWVTVNGDGAYATPVQQNERLRLRLVNVANARVFPLAFRGVEAWLVALDGMPVPEPRRVDSLTLGPAQRADLIVDVTAAEGETALIFEPNPQGALAVADFPVQGQARAAAVGAPAALPPNPVAPLGPLDDAPVAEMRMEGGAMGRLPGGMTMQGGTDGSDPQLWALAGQVGMGDAPFMQADLGQTVRVRLINDTAWDHAMHLHGHHFHVLGPDGPGALRDTLLVRRRETAEIAFVADNPGDWLLHCHMVEHAASGMMNWIRVG